MLPNQLSLKNQQILEKSAVRMMQEIEKTQLLEDAKSNQNNVSREKQKN